MEHFDRKHLRFLPLCRRTAGICLDEVAVDGSAQWPEISAEDRQIVEEIASAVLSARAQNRPVIVVFGAHLIKNGLGPLVVRMVEQGWITHLATNGAGSIHDWEFAFCGRTSEDVRAGVASGTFGLWQETGMVINLAVAAGILDGLGYGWSVGRAIVNNGIAVPDEDTLRDILRRAAEESEADETAAAAADLLSLMRNCDVAPGFLQVIHRFAPASVQAAAWRATVPFTVHPGIGYDITAIHPACSGGAIGRAAHRDFLAYAASVRNLEGGVHIVIGSAVMAPMIFEKALSMANNLRARGGACPLTQMLLIVNDIHPVAWDWKRGEPQPDNPAYFFRVCKTFSRMGGTFRYLCLDNRIFLRALYAALAKAAPTSRGG